MWKSKFYGPFVLNHRVVLHAIDATPARWRGDAGSSPLDRARSACTRHWLVSTQVKIGTTYASYAREVLQPDYERFVSTTAAPFFEAGDAGPNARQNFFCARLVTDASMAARAAAWVDESPPVWKSTHGGAPEFDFHTGRRGATRRSSRSSARSASRTRAGRRRSAPRARAAARRGSS